LGELTKEEIAKFNLDRSKIYAFLARVYREEIDQGFLKQMAKKPVKIEDPEIDKGYRMLERFMQQTKGRDVLDDLAAEYADMFLGFGRDPAYPCGSVYLSKKKLVMQEQRIQVLEMYRRFGLGRIREFKEPEDHIAIELEFMSYLCQETKEALVDGCMDDASRVLEAQSSFLNEHLKPWVPKFCDDIQACAKLDFYRAVAKITEGFLGLEEENISQLISELK